MWIKTATIIVWFLASYLLLLLWATTPLQAVLLSVSLGLSIAGIGFNLQHDGSHGSYSSKRWLNKIMATFLDLTGGSSYLWKWQHNVIHHTYTNVEGIDEDLKVGALGRLAPDQKRLAVHRFQHIYIWFLYAFLPLKWWFLDDYVSLGQGRLGDHKVPRPRGVELFLFFFGKFQFYAWALVLPLFLHSWTVVVPVLVLTSFVTGVTLAVVFQLAHCLEEADFPARPANGELELPFDESQLATTVDFARNNPLATWFLGGLNFQVEHHLFPKICHIHYSAIAPIVEKTCAEFGIPYRNNVTFFDALRSHARWLYRMGRAEPA